MKNLRKSLALSGAHPISGLFRHILVPSGSFPILTFWHRFSLVADSPCRLSVAVLEKPQEKLLLKNLRKSLFSLATCGTSWLSGDVITRSFQLPSSKTSGKKFLVKNLRKNIGVKESVVLCSTGEKFVISCC